MPFHKERIFEVCVKRTEDFAKVGEVGRLLRAEMNMY
jgi:hypothetical protein